MLPSQIWDEYLIKNNLLLTNTPNLTQFLSLYRKCKKFGTQSWICIAIIVTEILITVKFDWNLITMPIPPHILKLWIIGFSVLLAWTIWHFYLQRLLWHTEQVSKNSPKKRPKNNNTQQDQDTAPQTETNGVVRNGASQIRHRNGRH